MILTRRAALAQSGNRFSLRQTRSVCAEIMTIKELSDWRGNRADAGRLAHGLPKSNKFNRGVE